MLVARLLRHLMTYKAQIDYIKANYKSQRTFNDYVNYFVFIFPLAFLSIGLSMLFNFFKFQTGLPVFLVGLCFICMGTAFGIFTAKRLTQNLTYEQINPHQIIDIDDTASKIKTLFKTNNIHIDRANNVITATTKWSAFSWGELITIIKLDNNSILINSRPNGFNQPVTIIKDRQNIKRLKQMFT